MAIEAAASGVGAAVLGSLGQLAFGTKPVQEWLQGCQTRLVAGRMLPGNQDLVKGIRTAHLCSLDHVARRYRQELQARSAAEQSEEDRLFAANLDRLFSDRLKLAHERGIDHDTLAAEDIGYVLGHLVHPGTSEGYGEVAAHARATALAELERDAGYTLPALFRAIFTAPGGWHDAFDLFVTERLKTNERFRSIFYAGKLVEIDQAIAALGEQQAAMLAECPDLRGFVIDVRGQLGWIAHELTEVREAGRPTFQTVLGTASVVATVWAGNQRIEQKIDRTLDELVAAAKAEARHEVERLRLEVSLKDRIIGAKD